jgi:hypothetical protein
MVNINTEPAIERALLVVWIGGIWTVGFLVAPTLFAMIDDRSIAGNVAGRLFSVISHVGLVCGVLLLALAFRRTGSSIIRQWRTWIIGLMLLLTLVGQYVVTPMMQEIRQARLQAALIDPQLIEQFQWLHGISSGLYFLTALLGLVVVLAGALPTASGSRSGR